MKQSLVAGLVFLPALALGQGKELPVGGLPGDVATADTNGDGLPDLVVVKDGNSVQVFLGKAGGGFDPGSSAPLRGWGPHRLLLGDVNRDGKADLVVLEREPVAAGETRLSVRLAESGGTFAAEVLYPATAPGFAPTGATGSDLALADVDGDGEQDLVVALDPFGVSVLRGLGQGTFAPGAYSSVASSPPGNSPYAHMNLAAGDLDGDGRDEVLVSSGRRLFRLDWQGGQAILGPALPLGTDRDAVCSLAVADFDRDGVLDAAALLCDLQTASIHFLRGDPAGNFSSPAVVSPAVYDGSVFDPGNLRVGDLDGDLRPDLLFTARYRDQVIALYGNGKGRFVNFSRLAGRASYSEIPVGASYLLDSLAVADFDSDGVLDFAAGPRGDALWIYSDVSGPPPSLTKVADRTLLPGESLSLSLAGVAQDGGTNGAVNLMVVPHGPTTAATDVNGDGRLDLRDALALFDAVSRGLTDPVYDLDGDGLVTSADQQAFVEAWKQALSDPRLVLSPDPLTTASSTRTLTFTPDPATTGDVVFTVYASQGIKVTSQNFKVTVLPPAAALPVASARSSSSYSSSYGPEKAVDGQRYTFWVGAYRQPSWTLTLDLGSERILDSLEVDWYYLYSSSNFDVEVSSDGVAFAPLATGLSQAGTTSFPYVVTTQIAPPTGQRVRARYVRLVVHQADRGLPIVSELRVRGW